jgi:hypothetical protein
MECPMSDVLPWWEIAVLAAVLGSMLIVYAAVLKQ